ncbi:MAG: transglycosylase family protein [Mycobacterium sp.]
MVDVPRRTKISAQRSALLAGLAGALVLLGLTLGSGTASADSLNWDAIAQCETGGNWSADTGNGFAGGLQFKPSTWAANGGIGSPAHASREQQIAVAERVLATQGINAWPTCGTHGESPAIWSTPTHSTGCASIRQGAVLGIFDLRQFCSAFLGR